jgi:DNA-binding NarL/FixJ family response regulator
VIVPLPQKAPARVERLTRGEVAVLVLAAKGLSNDEIRERLGLGREAIRYRSRRILRKLGAANRCHAVAIAYESGIIAPGQLTDGLAEAVAEAAATSSV